MTIVDDHSELARSTAPPTLAWLEAVVVGLNLCPFAKLPIRQGRIRVAVSDARDENELLSDLADELARLQQADPAQCETTLLIHPQVLADFHQYNDFLDAADTLLDRLALEGEFQVASFHPDYQFADTTADDVTNCSNRSPFPMLHLLREASVEAAIDSVGDTDAIVERNMARLRELGWTGLKALSKDQFQ